MAERPAIQLYFGDFEGNEKVKRCSWPARGALLYVMGLLHRSDEYGVLRWPLKEIAGAIGAPPALVKELATKGALKGSDTRVQAYRWAPSHAGKRGPEIVLIPEQEGPLWYSSRMVKDEYKRTNRGIGTRFGAPGKLPTGGPNHTPSGTPSQRNGDGNGSPHRPPNQREGDGASSSSSLSKRSSEVTPQNPGAVDNSAHDRPTDTAAPLKINGAEGKNARSTARVNGPGQDWGDLSWVTATATTIGERRRQNESDEDFTDRIFVATQRRMDEAARVGKRS